MPYAMIPIYTQTVGAGVTAASITFNNIPSIFTDLIIKCSARENTVTGTSYVANVMRFNGDTATNYSWSYAYGSGTAASSTRSSAQTYTFVASTPTSVPTANTFSNYEIYIPNYTSSNFKQIISDTVNENNASFAEQLLVAGLWRNTAAINSVTIYSQIAFTQHSTFTLYGIKKS